MPELLTLNTNLKSLKYGQDRPGGGDSRQPYIKTDINTVDTGFNKLRLTKFDDGLIRGGVIGAINSSVVDTLRISKFFIDFPKGPLFLVKQVGLQLSGPRLESKQLSTNNPTSGQGFLNNVGNLITNVANTITNAVGPTRIYNLGLNTLAQVPVNAIGGHIVRHGLLPIQNEDTKYFSVVQNNNQNGTNRLLRLSTKFRLGDGKLNDSIDKGLIGSINQGISTLLASRGLSAGPSSFLSINRDDATIDNYIGGPSSVYGIGRTLIKRYDNTEDVARIDPLITYSNIFAGTTRNSKGDPEEVKIKDTRDFLLSTPFYQKSDLNSKSWKYDDGTLLDNSFLSSIANDKDKNDTNTTKQKNSYSDANTRAKNKFFYGVSNYSSSVYVSGGLQDTSGITPSLDYRISNINDKNDINVVNQKNSYNDATQRAQSGFFYGVSNFSSSVYVSGSDLKDPSGISSSLDYRIASIVDTQTGSYSNIYAGKTRDNNGAPSDIIGYNDLGLSKQYSNNDENEIGNFTNYYPDTELINPVNAFSQTYLASKGIPINTSNDVTVTGVNRSYKLYKSIINSKQLNYNDNTKTRSNTGIYGDIGVGNDVKSETNFNESYRKLVEGILPTSTATPLYVNSYGETVTINNIPWNKVTREKRVGSGRKDEINLTPMFDESKTFGDDNVGNNLIRDLVKFRIQAVNTNSPDKGKWMVFRAYLTDLSDDSTSEWQDIKYAGRGDKFYIYTGFTRKINVSFKVAALSDGEMQFIYQKLNFLMSNTMPDYENELMRGPLTRLTVGNWIDGQLGILNSVNFKVPQDSPWEIALDEPEGGKKQLILPHIVEVSLSFTPIGAETAGNNLINKKDDKTSYIAQNNTGDLKFQYIK